MTKSPGPVVIELDADNHDLTPETAPMVLDGPAEAQRSAMATATHMVARPMSWLARIFWIAFSSLLLLWIGTLAWDFVFTLLDRNVWLGRFATAAGAVVLLAVLIASLRELAGFRRLAALDSLRRTLDRARADGSTEKAVEASRAISHFYRTRPELEWPRADLARMEAEVLDGPARLDLTEAQLMTPLDDQALAHVRTAARQVATVTALVPLAFADVLVALIANLRMVRQIAEVYGGRSGKIGSWRLMRAVALHLVATGAVGVADDMVSSVIGGGAVARISRRFGEGIINGALTARVGLAAMELCRPMPFVARKRPGVSAVVRDALAGLFTRNGKSKASTDT